MGLKTFGSKNWGYYKGEVCFSTRRQLIEACLWLIVGGWVFLVDVSKGLKKRRTLYYREIPTLALGTSLAFWVGFFPRRPPSFHIGSLWLKSVKVVKFYRVGRKKK